MSTLARSPNPIAENPIAEIQQLESAKRQADALTVKGTIEKPLLAVPSIGELIAQPKLAEASPPATHPPAPGISETAKADIPKLEVTAVQDELSKKGVDVENSAAVVKEQVVEKDQIAESLGNHSNDGSLVQSVAPTAPRTLPPPTAPLAEINTIEPMVRQKASESLATLPAAAQPTEPKASQELPESAPTAAPAEQALADLIGSRTTPQSEFPDATPDVVQSENDTWLGVDAHSNTEAQLSRRVAQDSGFGLLPLEELQEDNVLALPVAKLREESLTATIHATRLRELAQESLRQSHHRLQRGAVHSAKKFAVEALHSVVAMRDAQAGGNHHAKHLETAFDAIRESEDFGGRFVAVDQNALKRVVGVHKTDVLKSRDLDHVSALEATDAYLGTAKSHFAMAGGNVPEASEALVLLGEIEKQISRPNDARSAAVAVALQRAAVEISPSSARGFRALGNTLLQQGLVQQAAGALNQSVQIQPTRAGYEQLMLAAQRLGDIETIRICRESLTQIPDQDGPQVRNLTPTQFAATYRPDPMPVQTPDVKPAAPRAAKSPEADKPRISVRSLFPFTRR